MGTAQTNGADLAAVARRLGEEAEMYWRMLTAPFRQLPAIVIIGTQKGGTTSLYRYLCRHPVIEPSFRKEVHYFDRHHDRHPLWYRGHFPFAGDRIALEATPHYLFDDASLHRMSALVPDATLIAVLRDPVARAFSHYQHVQRGMSKWGRDHRSFEEAVRADMAVAQSGRLLGRNEYRDLYHSYVRRGIYAPQVERYRRVYGDNLIVLKSETLFEKTREVLASLFRRLGMDPIDIDDLQAHGSGAYGDDIPMKEELQAFYAPHNRELSELLDRDFTWGY
jgi:hypothetical protein